MHIVSCRYSTVSLTVSAEGFSLGKESGRQRYRHLVIRSTREAEEFVDSVADESVGMLGEKDDISCTNR